MDQPSNTITLWLWGLGLMFGLISALLSYLWKGHDDRLKTHQDALEKKANLTQQQEVEQRLSAEMDRIRNENIRLEDRQIREVEGLKQNINGLAARLGEAIEQSERRQSDKLDIILDVLRKGD
jgi:hypothetical protein